MKADGGALVYIILAVIAAVVNAVVKSKKKDSSIAPKPSPTGTPAPRHEPQATWQKELEDIFGNVLKEPEPVTKSQKQEEVNPFSSSKQETKNIPQASITQEWNKYAELKKSAGSESKTAIKSEPLHVIEEEHELAEFHIEDFELNKAIIYSEVLNRKYF